MRDPQSTRLARGELARATGHRYAALSKEVEGLSIEAQMELIRLIRSLKDAVSSEKRKRHSLLG
jgi:hypothetical protein